MHNQLAHVNIDLTVGYYQARAIRSACRAQLRKLQGAKKAGFVPEPGRLDLNDEGIKHLAAIIQIVDAALVSGVQKES